MKISDYIVSFFADKGITDVFGYPGGMVTHLMDSFGKHKDRICAHTNYHEQGAAFCACGYAQTSHLPGVAYATSGPGATNLVTGIANAYFDSVPCIFLTGQVNTYESKGDLCVRQKGFQETDIISIVNSITKYSVRITEAENVRYEMEKAYFLSSSGRPGPVLLDIPMNIQRQEIEPNELKGFVPSPSFLDKEPNLSGVFSALEAAERPCIIVGAGVKICGMVKEFKSLAAKWNIPVVSSMLAVDVLPANRKNYYGFIGAYGDRKANFILAKSDLIISLGSRLDCRQTGNNKEQFAPNARLIRIDIDEGELSNIIKPDELQIVADLRIVIPLLNEYKVDNTKVRFAKWIEVCREISDKLANLELEMPNRAIKELSHILSDDTVITTDVGQNQVWVAQSFDFKNNQQMLYTGGHGAMGYSLPAAIGACYGSDKNVVCFTGDGGFQMNMQELQFVARENLPIKIVILNNSALGMIRHFQEMYFDSYYMQTVKDNGYTVPSFKKIAAAYELPYYRIEKSCNFEASMFHENGPAIIEIVLPQKTYVFPKLAINKQNQDQEPLLGRSLFNYLMKL